MLQQLIIIYAENGCALCVSPHPVYRWCLTITAGAQTQESYYATQSSALMWASRYTAMIAAGMRVRP